MKVLNKAIESKVSKIAKSDRGVKRSRSNQKHSRNAEIAKSNRGIKRSRSKQKHSHA